MFNFIQHNEDDLPNLEENVEPVRNFGNFIRYNEHYLPNLEGNVKESVKNFVNENPLPNNNMSYMYKILGSGGFNTAVYVACFNNRRELQWGKVIRAVTNYHKIIGELSNQNNYYDRVMHLINQRDSGFLIPEKHVLKFKRPLNPGPNDNGNIDRIDYKSVTALEVVKEINPNIHRSGFKINNIGRYELRNNILTVYVPQNTSDAGLYTRHFISCCYWVVPLCYPFQDGTPMTLEKAIHFKDCLIRINKTLYNSDFSANDHKYENFMYTDKERKNLVCTDIDPHLKINTIFRIVNVSYRLPYAGEDRLIRLRVVDELRNAAIRILFDSTLVNNIQFRGLDHFSDLQAKTDNLNRVVNISATERDQYKNIINTISLIVSKLMILTAFSDVLSNRTMDDGFHVNLNISLFNQIQTELSHKCIQFEQIENFLNNDFFNSAEENNTIMENLIKVLSYDPKITVANFEEIIKNKILYIKYVLFLINNVKSISNELVINNNTTEKITLKDISELINKVVTVPANFQLNYNITDITDLYQNNHCENMVLFMNFLLFKCLNVENNARRDVREVSLIQFILSILSKSATTQTSDFDQFLQGITYINGLYNDIGDNPTLLTDDEHKSKNANMTGIAKRRCAKLFKQRMLYTLLVSLLDFKTINSTYKSILSPMNSFATIHMDQIYQNFNNNMPFRSSEYSNKNFGKSLFSMCFNSQFVPPIYNQELLKFMSIFSYTLTGSEYFNDQINDFNRGNFMQSKMFEDNSILSIDQFYAIIFILFDAGINYCTSNSVDTSIRELYEKLRGNRNEMIVNLRRELTYNLQYILGYMREWRRYITNKNNEDNNEGKIGTTSFDYASISKDFNVDNFFNTDRYFTMDYNINYHDEPAFNQVDIRQGKIKSSFQISPANCSLNINNNVGEMFFDIEGDYGRREIDPRILSKVFVEELIYYLFNNITAFIDYSRIRQEMEFSQMSNFIQAIHNCINMQSSSVVHIQRNALIQAVTNKIFHNVELIRLGRNNSVDPDIARFIASDIEVHRTQAGNYAYPTRENIRKLVTEVVNAKELMKRFQRQLFDETVITTNTSSMHLISLHVYMPIKCNYADLRIWIIKMQKMFGKMHDNLMLDSIHKFNKYDHVFEYLDPNVYVDTTHVLRVPYSAKGFIYEDANHTLHHKYYKHSHMLNLIEKRRYHRTINDNEAFDLNKSKQFKSYFTSICTLLNEKILKPTLSEIHIDRFIVIPNLYDYHRIIIKDDINPGNEVETIKNMFKQTVLSPYQLFNSGEPENWSSNVHTLTFDKFFAMSEYFIKQPMSQIRGYNGLDQMDTIRFRSNLENNWLNLDSNVNTNHRFVNGSNNYNLSLDKFRTGIHI